MCPKQEVFVKSIAQILSGLQEMQELDRQIQSLRSVNSAPPGLAEKRSELDGLRRLEQEKVLELAQLRMVSGRADGALELCRNRFMKADSATKSIKSAPVLAGALKELDQLKEFEQSLELNAKNVRKEIENAQSLLKEMQIKRSLLENDVTSQSGITRGIDSGTMEQIRELEKKKVPIRDHIPLVYSSLYLRLIAMKGTAVAGLRGNSCMGCYMVLPAQFVNDLRRSATIQQCPSCKRILDGTQT
jgi:predicted  nucleic acid-binding Zn-ribbon protein